MNKGLDWHEVVDFVNSTRTTEDPETVVGEDVELAVSLLMHVELMNLLQNSDTGTILEKINDLLIANFDYGFELGQYCKED